MTLPAAALFKREFLALLRTTRAYIVLVLFVLACVVAASILLPHQDPRYGYAGYGGTVSREIMYNLSMLLLISCGVLVPALAATSIVVEREQETLEGLLTTLIRPSGIIAGKLLNTIGFFLLLTVALLPLGSVVFFLVGVDWSDLAQAFVLIVICAFSCAMAGILSSAWFRRTFAAIAGAYIGAALGILGLLLLTYAVVFVIDSVEYFLYYFGLGGWHSVRNWDVQLSPVQALDALFHQRLHMIGLLGVCVAQFAFCALCFGLTLWILRRPPRPAKTPGFKPIDDADLLRLRRKTWPFYLIDPMKRRAPIEDGRNPMLVREIRWGVVNRGTFLIRLFFVSFAVCLLSSLFAAVVGDPQQAAGWFIKIIVLTVLIAPVFLANAFTKEHELGNFDMLRLTLLRPRELVLGKLFGGAVAVSPIFLGTLPAAVALLIGGAYTWRLLFTGYVSLMTCLALSVCLGLFASLLTRRTSTALVLTYVFTAIVFFASTAVSDLLLGVLGGEMHSLALSLASPLGGFAMMADTVQSTRYRYFPGAGTPPVELGTAWVHWAASMAIYGACCIGLIQRSLVVFARRWQQDN